MEHAEALDLLAGAAAEPASLRGALEGSDPAWRHLREHLAICDACTQEYLAWLRLAQAVAAAPPDGRPVERVPAALKGATLALVRSAGVERGTAAAGAPAAVEAAPPADGSSGVAPVAPVSSIGPGPEGARAAGRGVAAGRRTAGWRLRRPRLWPALGGIGVAAAIVALVGTLVVTSDLNRQLQATRGDRAELARVATTVDRLMQAQDHQVVVLDAVDGGGAGGSVIWSTTSGALVVLSQTLPPPPAGMTYRCWVVHQGTRQPVGDMHFQGTLAYWAGSLSQWGGPLQAGDQFGVSLTSVTGGVGGTPVLEGSV